MDAATLTIFWFRRDLRCADNVGLGEALKSPSPVVPIFIFDQDILKSLAKDDARVTFIHEAVRALDQDLRARRSGLQVHVGRPLEIFQKLAREHKISAVYTNEDYEPYAIRRDGEVAEFLASRAIEFKTFKDQVAFAKDDIVKGDGEPYRMFTPYSRQWLAHFATSPPRSVKIPTTFPEARFSFSPVPTLAEMGFRPTAQPLPAVKMSPARLKAYAGARDYMAEDATTRVGTALRFGTISVRQAIAEARKHSEVWLKELIWREFFQMILFHFPHTVDHPFDPRFEKFPWRDSREDFAKWQEGMTGYPIVDAGMRELKATGFMHNRARMIVGSFLCKHLLLPWVWGERYFASQLHDFELSSNVGNWQWVAGCGVDAAPYFRIFNPALQTKKFDAAGTYIKKWVPECDTPSYPEPMVDHEHARRRALLAYDKIRTIKK